MDRHRWTVQGRVGQHQNECTSVPASTWTEHFLAARDGSPEALGQILQDCRPYLMCLANEGLYPALQSKAGAADLVQDTFLEAQRDFVHFRGETRQEFLAWLRQVLRHNIGTFIRHYRGTRQRQINREIPLNGTMERLAKDRRRVGFPDTPSSFLQKQELLDALNCALEQLPAHYQQVIQLRYEEQLPFTEISQRLGRSPKAVHKLWTRALVRLHHLLTHPR